MRRLEDMLSEGKADIGEVEVTDKKNKVDKTDWVARASLRNWDVKGETEEEEPAGALTYIVRLCGAEDATEPHPDWPWLDQACLIMGWHKGETAYWNIEYFEPYKL